MQPPNVSFHFSFTPHSIVQTFPIAVDHISSVVYMSMLPALVIFTRVNTRIQTVFGKQQLVTTWVYITTDSYTFVGEL